MEVTLYWRIGICLWAVWLISWWTAALWRDRKTVQAPTSSWRWQFLVVAIGFVLLFVQRPGLPGPLWRLGPVGGWTMVGLITVSFAFSWWARAAMGRLWSGGIERTADHRVIQDGPFAWVRHPIYTSMIGAAIGLAVIAGTPLALIGAAFIALGFGLKAKVEERFLTQELTGYPEYRTRVSMLVPLPPRR